jgi:hypothetical protein
MNHYMEELLDHAHLQAMVEFTGGSACRVIDRFATGLPDRITHIQALMEQPEKAALRAEIHCLKGSSVTCGFKSLGDLLHAIDLSGADDFQRLEDCAVKSIIQWLSFRNTTSASFPASLKCHDLETSPPFAG